jgi:hypothetical protein
MSMSDEGNFRLSYQRKFERQTIRSFFLIKI